MNLTFIDLFSGIGGFRVGMELAGFNCIFSNDYDPFAAKTYQTWYGSHNHVTKSLWDIDIKRDIPNHDILCGGFPCQPFSQAGKKLGFADNKQGDLFDALIQVIKSKKPKVVFLENVSHITTYDNFNTIDHINRQLERNGYLGSWIKINAKYWVPQNRRRVYFLYFSKSKLKFNKLKKLSLEEKLNDISFQPDKKIKYFSSIKEKNPARELQIGKKTWDCLKRLKIENKRKGNGFGYTLLKDFKLPRKLSVNEALLLMGFNNQIAKKYGFKNGFPQVVSNTQAYKQLGNSVVPQVIYELGMLLRDEISVN